MTRVDSLLAEKKKEFTSLKVHSRHFKELKAFYRTCRNAPLNILLLQKWACVAFETWIENICNIWKVLFYSSTKWVSLLLAVRSIKKYQHGERFFEGLVAFFQERQQLISTLSISEDYPEQHFGRLHLFSLPPFSNAHHWHWGGTLRGVSTLKDKPNIRLNFKGNHPLCSLSSRLHLVGTFSRYW